MIKKCLKNKNEDFDKDLINRFANTYRFCNKDYTHAQKVFEELKIKNLDDYHDFNVQSDTLLVADVIENFRNKCIEICEVDSAHFLSAPGLAQQACLKKAGVKLELLTDIDMLLVVEKGIRGRICHAIHRYAKANKKYMKNCDKTLSHPTSCSQIQAICMDVQYLKNFLSMVSNGRKKFIILMNTLQKILMKIVIRDVFLKQMLNTQKLYLIFIVIYHFYPNKIKLKNVISLFVTYMTKKTMLFI